MNDVTDYLFEMAGGLIKRQLEIRDEGNGYEMADTGAVELEVGTFLYGLTRLIKPKKALTTGVYTGISDMYIAQGMKRNGYGEITAIEFEPQHRDRAIQLWKQTQVADHIRCLLMSSLDYVPEYKFDLMFLDTEPDIRFAELVKFYPNLEPGGIVLLHDLHHHLGQEIVPDSPQPPFWPWGEMPQEIKEWIRTGELKPWYFSNPRGMTGFQRRKDGDYA